MEWKTIPLFDGNYEASSNGDIRKKTSSTNMYQEKNSLGYKSVKIKYKGKRKNYKVHRLVALAFIPNFNNYPVVNHKDENPSNNCVNNLEWCTQKYNMNYGTVRNRLSKSHTGKKCNNHLNKTILQFDLDMNFICEFSSISDASKVTNIDRSNIRAICSGKTKKPRKYIFKFKEEY